MPLAPLFAWADLPLAPIVRPRSRAPLSETSTSPTINIVFVCHQTFGIYSSYSSNQFDLGFMTPPVRFVPRNKHRVLARPVGTYFGRGFGRFMRVGFKLEDAGIVFVGDLVKMSERDFRRFTRSEAVVAHVKRVLAGNDLAFEMVTPCWRRPNPYAVSLG